MDEAVKIPIQLDGSMIHAQLAEISNLLKQQLGRAGSDALKASTASYGQWRNAATLGFKDVASSATQASSTIVGAFTGVAATLAGVVAGAVSIRAAIGLVTEGIKNADYLRDLQASTNALSSSVAAGEAAFERLDKAGQKTRVTGDTLVKLYGEVLPLAFSRGFSEEGAQRFVTQIAKLAPAIGKSVEETMSMAAQILSGRVRKTNLLAHALGLDPDAYTKGLVGLESVFPKIDELAARGEKMGQTWATAGMHIKDALLDAFSEGFNEARSGVNNGINDLILQFRNPELLGAIHELGVAVAEIAPTFIKLAQSAAEAAVSVIDSIKQMRAAAKQDAAGPGGQVAGVLSGLFFSAGDEARSQKLGQTAADRRKTFEYQTKFDQAFAKTGEVLPKDVYGPAIPSLLEYVGLVDKSAAVQKHWSDELAGTNEHLKRVREGTDQFTSTLSDSQHGLREAQLAFEKLFAPPETDSLLKAFADLDANAAQFAEKLDAAHDKLVDMAGKAGVPPELRAQLLALADGWTDLAGRIPEATAAKKEYLSTEAWEKEVEGIKKAGDAVEESLATAFEGLRGDAPLEAFAGVKAEFDKVRKEFADAVSFKEATTGITPAELAALEAKAQIAGQQIGAAFKAGFQATSRAISKGIEDLFSEAEASGGVAKNMTGLLSGISKTFEENVAKLPAWQRDAYRASSSELVDNYKKAAKAAGIEFAAALDGVAQTMADLFTAGVEGGAEGFANAASSLFLKNVNEGAKGVFKSLALLAFGAPPKESDFPDTAQGARDFATASAESAQQAQQLATVFEGVVGAIGQTMRIFQQAKQGQAPSILGTTLSFAATGASIGTAINAGMGTIIGAAVGAIVGAIVGILASAKAKAEQVFATYGIRGGQPYVEAAPGQERQFENLSAATYQEMLDTIRKTWESTTNDYIKLIGRFGKDIADGVQTEITKANFTPQIDASKMGIKNFMADFQYWVEHGLVQGTIGEFRAPLLQGFEALGLSAERFAKIWTRLSTIDPSQAIDRWNELYDALVTFSKIELELSPDQYGVTVGLFTQAQADAARSFADSLAAADFNLVQMGDTMSKAIGPEQITMAKEWGDALLQRQQAVKQFFQEVAAAIDGVIAGYQSKIRDLTLAGMKTAEGGPDVEAQVNYLKKYADSLWAQITQATTPEQVLRLSDELSATISKIQQVGGAQSVEAAEAYRQWAIAQLTRAQDLVVTQLENLARDVAAQNAAFLDAIQGFIDAFRNATDVMTDIVTAKPGPDTGVDTPPPGDTAGHRGRPPGMAGDPWYGSPDHPLAPTRPEPTEPGGRGIGWDDWWGGYTGGLGGNPWMAYGANTGTPQPQVGETPVMADAQWDRFTAQLVDFAGGRDAVDVQRFGEQNQLLAEIRDILAAGRDVRVSGGVDINIEGEEIFVPADDGFVRREVNARGRR